MAAEISNRVREIAAARGLPGSEVFEQALERGLEALWEDLVLAQYLDGDLDREDAIDRVGRPKVERAERERDAVEDDVDWGLNAWGVRLSTDAGPLIHLAEIDALELLAVFDTFVIPETVYEELERGGLPDGISELPYELVEATEAHMRALQRETSLFVTDAVVERGIQMLDEH